MMDKLDQNIEAILFDLDGTLIDVDLDVFIPQYLKMLASTVAHLVPVNTFIPNIMKASKAVDENDGRDTNENIYADTFFPLIGYPRDEIEPIFMEFYKKDFPKLKDCTRTKPEARVLMKTVFDLNLDAVIATTPVLPATAIEQRLEWAGVSVTEFPYKLVTTIENSSANKPNLLYYEQILEKINRPAEACLMVGDEDKDLEAARLGLKTFLVKSPNTKIKPSTPKPTYTGTLADLNDLLKNSMKK